jgi:hypothetical protein
MDKPRHPNVIRPWAVRNPAPGVPPTKNQIDRRNVRGVPQGPPSPRSSTPKPKGHS